MKTIKILASGMLFAIVALNAMAAGDGETKTAAAAWPKRPVWAFRLGGYFSNSSSQVRVDGPNGPGTEIDVTDVLKIPRTATVFRANGDFRIASWFGVEAEYYGVTRSRTATIDREFTAGDTVFGVHDTVSTRYQVSYLDLALKFFLIHRPRFDLGLWVGGKAHFLHLDLKNESAQLGTTTVDRKTWFPVPAGGAVFSYTLARRLFLYGKAGWFSYKVSDQTRFDNTRFDISLDYYFWRSLGIGAAFAYNKSTVATDNADFAGLTRNRDSGLQVYAMIGF